MHRSISPAPVAGGHRPLLLILALAAAFSAAPARAQPTGAQVIHGTASFNQQGANLTVTTQNGAATSHSAINWQSFSVPQGSTTHFAQPTASSMSINRVVAANPSAILGTLSSNGHLVLVNPSGITVGAGAVVDTARFTASTLRMGDADALAGTLRFSGGEGATLRINGQVVARQGDVVLIGQAVETGASAVVQSPQGATVLAAGQSVSITGRGLEGIFFEVQAPADQALNLGRLEGDAVGIFAGTLRHSGIVQTQATGTASGRVLIQAVSGLQAGAGSSIQSAGQLALVSSQGRVQVDGPLSAAGDLLVSAGSALSGTEPSIGLNADVQAPRVALLSHGCDAQGMAIGQAAGGIHAGELMLFSRQGSVSLQNTANRVQSLAASVASLHLVNTADVLSVRSLANPLVNSAIDGLQSEGGVTLDNRLVPTPPPTWAPALRSGSIRVEPGTTLGVGALRLLAAGDIVAEAGMTPGPSPAPAPAARLQTFGQTGAGLGALELQAGGAIRVGDLTTSAHDDAFAAPGAIGGGDVLLTAGSGVQVGTIRSDGRGAGSAAANAGHVRIAGGSGSVLVSGPVWARGGISGGRGGDGGDIHITAAGSISASDLHAGGGGGAAGGGDGGDVFVHSAGSVSVAGNGIQATGANSDNGGGGDGGRVVVTSAAGTLSLARVEAFGGWGFNGGGDGGSASLGAAQGSLAVGTINTAGAPAQRASNLVGSGSGVGGSGGAVHLHAGGSMTLQDIYSHGSTGSLGGGAGGGITLITGGGAITGGTVHASGGHGGNGRGGQGATVQVQLAGGGELLLGNVNAQGGNGSLGGAGGQLIATGGHLELDSIFVAGGTGASGGGAGGLASLAAAGGSVRVWEGIHASGGSASQVGPGGNAGQIRIQGDEVDVAGLGAVGGSGAGGGAGGDGGSIQVEAGSTLWLQQVAAQGGQGGHAAGGTTGGQGGRGGSVALTLQSGELDLWEVSITARGGQGGRGAGTGGRGGDGGSVTLDARGGGLYMNAPAIESSGARIDVGGGTGGAVTGISATARGGQGGHGGSVTLSATGYSYLGGEIDASGGDGGYAQLDGSAVTGSGGNGGSIRLQLGAEGLAVLAGPLQADGGLYGLVGRSEIPSRPDPARSGATGASGSLLTSGGTLLVPPPDGEGEQSVHDGYGQPAPWALPHWENRSNVLVEGGATARAASLRNFGAVTLSSGAGLALGSWAPEGPEGYVFQPATAPLVNEATGLLRGDGTVDAHVVNLGTIAPGAEHHVGIFAITGNLRQEAGGRLLFDVLTGAERQPGTGYDQLQVGGQLTPGGSLELHAITELPSASPGPSPSPAYSPAGLPIAALFAAAAAPTQQLELITAGSVAPDTGFAAIDTPEDLRAAIALRVGDQVRTMPLASAAPTPAPTTPPVASPAPTPAPTSGPATPVEAVTVVASVADRVEILLRLLGQDVPAALVERVVSEQSNVVSKLVTLLAEEEKRQEERRTAEEDKDPQRKAEKKAGAIVTETSCKPG